MCREDVETKNIVNSRAADIKMLLLNRTLPLQQRFFDHSSFHEQISVQNSKLLRHRTSTYRQTRDDRSTISRKSRTCVARSNDRSSITKRTPTCKQTRDRWFDVFDVARYSRSIEVRRIADERKTREKERRGKVRDRVRKASHLILNKDLLDDSVSMAAMVTKVDQSWTWLGLNSIESSHRLPRVTQNGEWETENIRILSISNKYESCTRQVEW